MTDIYTLYMEDGRTTPYTDDGRTLTIVLHNICMQLKNFQLIWTKLDCLS